MEKLKRLGPPMLAISRRLGDMPRHKLEVKKLLIIATEPVETVILIV